MNGPWLVQRLMKPPKKDLEGPFTEAGCRKKAHRVFGGHGIGLSEEGWDVVDEVFTIDYMGAAEYEFGVFPKTLSSLMQEAKANNLVSFQFEVDRENLALHPGRKYLRGKEKKEAPPPPKGNAVFYAVCREQDAKEVESYIRKMAAGKHETRDPHCIASALDPMRSGDRICGWLEITNGFFFTIDETMWRKFSAWFGLEV